MPNKVHIISQGETLTSVAKKHGFVDGNELFHHPSNQLLRINRPSPGDCQPNDSIRVPQSPIEKLEIRLETKRNLLREFTDEKKAQKANLVTDDAEFMLNSLDVASDVAGTLVGGGIKTAITRGGPRTLKGISKATLKGVGKTGGAMMVANATATYSGNENLKTAVSLVGAGRGFQSASGHLQNRDAASSVLKSFKEHAYANIEIAKSSLTIVSEGFKHFTEGVGKVLSWTSPSGIAQNVTGVTLEQMRDEELKSINMGGASIVQKLKEDIESLERQIAELKKQGYSRGCGSRLY